MAETAGLVIGAIALAGLFNTCVDFFDTIQLARNHGKDYEIAQMKLQLGRARLLLWGKTVWVADNTYAIRPNTQPNQTRLKLHPKWEAHWNSVSQPVEGALKALVQLFEDIDKVERKYGLKRESISSVQSQEVAGVTNVDIVTGATSIHASQRHTGSVDPVTIRFPNVKNMLEIAISDRQKKVGLGRKVSWAIHDRAKLDELISTISGFLDELESISRHVGTLEEQHDLMNEAVGGVTTPANIQLLEDATQDLPADNPSVAELQPIAMGNEFLRAVVHDHAVMINGSVGIDPAAASQSRTRHVDPQAFGNSLMINGPVSGDIVSELIRTRQSRNT